MLIRCLDGEDYRETINLEPLQARDLYSPLLTEKALADAPVFGPQRANIKSVVAEALDSASAEERLVADVSQEGPLCPSFDPASSIADKLKALRLAAKGGKDQPDDEALLSQRDAHEKLLLDTKNMMGLAPKERFAVDHTMLLRALEGYRFDFAKNQRIVADDPWLKDVWTWVAGELTW